MSWNTTTAIVRAENNLPAAHEIGAMIVRQRHIGVLVGATLFVFAVVYGLLLTDRYEARMEILVAQSQLRRADPVVTGEANAQPIVSSQSDTSDETLNSEIALLRSENVLRQVVKQSGLDRPTGLYYGTLDGMWGAAGKLHLSGVLRAAAVMLPFLRQPTEEQLTEKAVNRLAGKLQIEIVKLSDVIAISYRSSSPQQAAKVLRVLGNVYLNEHALAHYPAGELQFFQAQTEEAHAALTKSEQALVSFTQAHGVANGDTQLQDALKRLSDTKAAQDQTQAEIAATTQRIGALRHEATAIPQRQTTVLRSSDSAILLQQLKSQLLDLQLKRTQLLTQYQPTYPLVTEVDKQIAQAQAALADANRSQVEEKTTDRDPDYELVREEMTRARADLAGLQAQSATQGAELAADDREARWLEQQSVTQQALMRQKQAAEYNYLLLLHKEEAARVDQGLDRQRIFNVSIVQSPSVPALPVHSAWWYLIYGGLLGIFAGAGAALGADRLDPTLRTADEVESELRLPVLAVMPLSAEGQELRGAPMFLPRQLRNIWKLNS